MHHRDAPTYGISRRTVISGAAGLAAIGPLRAFAQDFPAAPIRLIVPAPAGGTMDTVSRAVSEKASAILGRPIIIDNKGGAAGNVAGEAAARSAPDGYSLLMGYDSLATNPHLYKLSFDPARDLVPVLLVGSFPIAVAIRNDFPVKDVPGFIAYVKQHPGQVSYGSPGIGSTHHLAAEMLAAEAGLTFLHVPYKGADGMTADLVGGRIDAGFFSIGSAEKLVQAGKARIIAVTDSSRYPTLPQVATLGETFPGLVVQTWFGLFAPKGLPQDRQRRIAEAYSQALRDPAVPARVSSIGVRIINGVGTDLGKLLSADTDRRGALIRKLNLQPQ